MSKVISIAANCQFNPFKKLVKNTTSFQLNYLSLHSSDENQVKEFHSLVKKSDLLITMLTKDDYRNGIGLGSNYLKSLLPPNSFSLVVPCVYYKGYYPTIMSSSGATAFCWRQNNFIKTSYLDCIFLILSNHKLFGINYEECFNTRNENIDFIVKEYHEKSIQELKAREEDCDLKISDFLLDSIGNKQCFLSFNHPTNHVLFEFYKRIDEKIFDYLEERLDLDLSPQSDMLDQNENLFIYPFVQNALCQNTIYKYKYNNSLFKELLATYKDKVYSIEDSIPYKNTEKILKTIGLI